MSIQHAVWRVGPKPIALAPSRLISEELLEEMIVADPSILSPDWMLIGRQMKARSSGIPDLLAIARDGSLVLIELKREQTPRDTIAQALDYASWVKGLGSDELAAIYSKFSNGGSLSEAFRSRFKSELDDEQLNTAHQIVVVASQLDAQSERIIKYLSEWDIPINVLFFQVFMDGDHQYLSRSWMIDPAETQMNSANATTSEGKEREPWNGEYYVSYGGWVARSWEEARRYGFISAGGGEWYTRTLGLLEPGARIWVQVPGSGYVGVGKVKGSVTKLADFKVNTSNGERPIVEVLEHASSFIEEAKDPAKEEHFVPVEWMATVPEDKALREVGLFGNQNTVCRPMAPKWRHTIEVLKRRFAVSD